MPLGILIGVLVALFAVSMTATTEYTVRAGQRFSFKLPLPSGMLEYFQTRPVAFVCDAKHRYKTSIISADPLVVYLTDFISDGEAEALMAVGEGLFKPSNVQKSGQTQVYTSRTSTSAFLPGDDAAVQCVLARARDFMGTLHAPGRDDMGAAQLVRYVEGQKFDVHHDWFDGKQVSRSDPQRRRWNRIVSFFAILEDDCDAGETWFPHVSPVEQQPPLPDEAWENMPREVRPAWRMHPDGGLGFRPIKGNAVFWVNLHRNGTGDTRTVHAGLPVGGGRKTAMNIWPKKYFESK